MKSEILFLFFVFFMVSVSAYDLRASPEEIVLDGFSGDVICEEIVVSLDEVGEIVVEDRWASSGVSERTFIAHNLNAEDIGLSVEYKDEFVIINEKRVEVCVSGDAGSYHGLFLFRVKGQNAGVGVWAVVNIEEKGFSMISGDVIRDIGSGNAPMFLLIGLMVVVFVLLVKKLVVVKRG